jgi:hypothetical protein
MGQFLADVEYPETIAADDRIRVARGQYKNARAAAPRREFNVLVRAF